MFNVGNSGAHVLVMDDDGDLAQRVKDTLKGEGYSVATATDYETGLDHVVARKPDLAIVDAELAGSTRGAGWRRAWQLKDIPVLMLAAPEREESIISELSHASDDFLMKPFSMQELAIRVRVLIGRIRRTQGQMPALVYADDYLTINLSDRRVMVEDRLVQLTPTEFRLLACLLRQAGGVLTYAELLEEVWGPEYLEYVDYVRIYVWRLRNKLERDPQEPAYILTEHGIGYRFEKAPEMVAKA